MKIIKKLTALIACTLISILNMDSVISDYKNIHTEITPYVDGFEFPDTDE